MEWMWAAFFSVKSRPPAIEVDWQRNSSAA
jgi:hypothetical protein